MEQNEKQSLALNEQGQAEESIEVAEGVSITMVSVPKGTYDEPDRDSDGDGWGSYEFTITDIKIGKYLITEGLWEAVMGSNPSMNKMGKDFPVENVSWDDVQEFITKLNTITGKTFRLPTEQELAFVATGGVSSAQYYGFTHSMRVIDLDWCRKKMSGIKHQVGTKANKLGIYDICNNVAEWCGTGVIAGPIKTGVLQCGIDWQTDGDWLNYRANCFVLNNFECSKDVRGGNIGFRLVLDTPNSASPQPPSTEASEGSF